MENVIESMPVGGIKYAVRCWNNKCDQLAINAKVILKYTCEDRVHKVEILEGAECILMESYDEKLNLFGKTLEGKEAMEEVYLKAYQSLLTFGVSELIEMKNKS